MTDRPTIVLSPEDWPNWVPDAVVIDASCGHRAWISPSSLMLLLSTGPDTICMRCLPPGPHTVEEVPGSREERVAAIGEEDADTVIELARQYFGRRR
jgi:hypothetical protein